MAKNEININGDEELILENERSHLSIYADTVAVPLMFSMPLGYIAGTATFINTFILIFIITALTLPKRAKKRNAKIKKSKELNTFFQRKFHIVNEFDPSKHESLGIVHAEKEQNMEVAMFQIYLKAYKLQADAIVINGATTSTHVNGSVTTNRNLLTKNTVSGVTSSYNTSNIMATLVKYKNTKVATDEKKEELEIEEAMA